MDFASVEQTAQEKLEQARDFLRKKNAIIFTSDSASIIKGMPNIVIHEITTEGLDLDADITTETIATKQSLTQHMVVKPADFSISGYVYDIVLNKTFLQKTQELFADRLATVDAFLPTPLTKEALAVYNKVEQVYQTTNAYVSKITGAASNVIDFISKISGNLQTKTQTTIDVSDLLESLFKSKILLSIKILNSYRDNVVMQHLTINRETSQTTGKIQVNITFKEIPVVENEAILAELPKIQRSSTENIGRVAGKTLDASETEQTKQSLLYSALFG